MKAGLLMSLFTLVLSAAGFSQPAFKFYTQPAGGGAAKQTFSTNEFIYARTELGKTVKEYFKLEDPAAPHILIFKFKSFSTDSEGKEYESSYTNGDYLYVKPEDLTKTSIDIDIMPDPAFASSVFCMVNNLKGAHYSCPLYFVRLNEKKNGSTIRYSIQLIGGTTEANKSGNTNLPAVRGAFDLNVNHADYEKLKQNRDLAEKKVVTDGMNLSALPPVFSTPFKSTDPKLTAAKLLAILKRDYPHRKVLKLALESDGGPLWLISKNNLDIPRYRYFNGRLHVAYMEDAVCKVGTVDLVENYLGAGRYAALGADYWSEYDRKINCGLIK